MSEPEDDFAALFAASEQARRWEVGQALEGRVVAIGHEVAFVDVGGKGEAQVALDELRDEAGALEVAVGDRIQAVVVATEGGLTLSRRLARGAVDDRQIEDAFHARLPVEGKVERVIKGGYEVRVARHRAFCPLSQIDAARTADPNDHVGRVYAFRITEYKDGGRSLVVSRRAVLEEEQRQRAAEVRKAIVPGAVLTGRVVSIREFGAFVDLGGGIHGLLHVSDMAWSRVPDILAVVAPGEEITVKVLRVDEGFERISLGLKQLGEDPWATVPARYEVGQVRAGRVTRLAAFGAFVELEPGVEALAHASTFPPTGQPGGWAKTVPVGLAGAFEVLTVEADKKRIGVAMVPEGASRATAAMTGEGDLVAGARLTGKVERHEPFGVFVFLGPGRTGLIPLAETGVAREADLKSTFPVGADVDVIVLEVDPLSRRIRLSHKAVIDARDADQLREYRERERAVAPEGFGTLADKLRGALGSRHR